MAEPACVIGAGIEIRGTLSGAGDLVICGRLEGQLALSDDHVTIDKTGVVVADVTSREVSVHGTVEGDITASSAVAVHGGARVMGNISGEAFELAPDAQFYGFLDMPVELPDEIDLDIPRVVNRNRATAQLPAGATTAPKD